MLQKKRVFFTLKNGCQKKNDLTTSKTLIINILA